MTRLFEEAVETVRALPPALQDKIARVVLDIASEHVVSEPMSAVEEASFAELRAVAIRGDFASDERMQAIWSKEL